METSTRRTDVRPLRAERAPPRTAQDALDASDRPLVLIVDDNADNLLALEAMLRRDDIEIVTAESGRAALEILLERKVAVAIVDVMMPEIDGFELAELVRGVDRTRRVPIIFVTAGSKADYRVFTGYETGAIDFLYKPVTDRVLQAKVDVLVSLEKQRQQIDGALQQAERARAETERLFRLAQATSQCEKPEDVYDPALEATRQILGADRAAILLFDDDGVMRFCGWRGLSESTRAALEMHSPWSCGERDAGPLLIPDIAEEHGEMPCRSVLLEEAIRAVGCVPLVSQGENLGKLLLCWAGPKNLSEHEKNLALTIASHVGDAIERLRLRDAERRARIKAEAAEQKLLAAVAELEQTLRYNEIFAGILAHDLRNPLNAILNAAQVLLIDGGRGGTTPFLERIVTSGTRMARMIDQLLDFTRARVGGGIELQPRRTNLVDVCRQAVGELELAHRDWRVKLDARGDATGTWDSDRLLQVASNLVANAGKHGAPGADIAVDVDGTDPEFVELSVHNAGTIEETAMQDLFSPFLGARERKSDGLGLGLFITRELVVSHGGTIDVASTQTAGTTFRILLPRRSGVASAGS